MDFTPEDERLIKEKWEELLQSCTKICKNDEDWEFIKRAFFLAKEAHGGVRRRSGEPYLLHPIAVAKIVVDEIGLGVKSVVAALLHDVVEDTEYTVEDMERIFGPKIAKMVDGLTKMSGVFNADTSEQAEYFRKVLLTLSDDVRVILIKIADRLHNMRTLGSMPTNKQIKITGETLYLFAPLAYRLGLYAIKSELEDIALRYLIWYGAGRFWIEALRTDSLLLVPSIGLRVSQVVAAVAVVGGVIAEVILTKRYKDKPLMVKLALNSEGRTLAAKAKKAAPAFRLEEEELLASSPRKLFVERTEAYNKRVKEELSAQQQ